MRPTELGIGVPGALGADAIADLATLAEQLGYRSFWFNCVAPHADPVALLTAAMARTHHIAIGTGVVPLSGYQSASLAPQLGRGGADDRRVILGVGAGGGRRGSLARVIDGIAHLRDSLPNARVVIGGKSPRMVAVGSAIADGLLLSMLTPDESTRLASHLRTVARHPHTVYSYHRVALDPGAADRVHAEMASHGAWSRDGAAPRPDQLIGTVLRSGESTDALVDDFGAFPADWIPVLRPLPARPDDLDDWRHLFRVLSRALPPS
jgi:alkanesulfonate monooxygenase SsuD/methylene tetrahydromethanopterin reductase-like flavin-dependent oxidoreductase (luciferase family)